MERIRDIQAAEAAFEAPRKQMQISPFAAHERMEKESTELFEVMWTDPTPEQTEVIASEIADVFLFLIVIANRYGINMGEAAEKKLEQNNQRFPVELFDGTNGKSFKENYEEAKRREGKPVPKVYDYSSVNFEKDSHDI